MFNHNMNNIECTELNLEMLSDRKSPTQFVFLKIGVHQTTIMNEKQCQKQHLDQT